MYIKLSAFPGGSVSKESACSAGDPCSIPGSRKRRGGLPTPVFLPRKSYGQKSLVGHSSWGHKESDMTEWLTHSHILNSSCKYNGLLYVVVILKSSSSLTRVWNGYICIFCYINMRLNISVF